MLLCPFAAWGQDVWDGSVDTDWYTGHESDPSYTITTPEQLAGLAQLVNEGNTFEGKTITLANDIVLNEGVLKENGELNGGGSNFKQWTPIGKGFNNQFNGTFDGQGYTISGIYINNENADNQGLFGYVDNKGEITNVRVEDSYFDVNYSVGGIVGENYGTVSNCSNSGTVTGTANYVYVGGIVGRNGGTVENCSNSGAVTGTGSPNDAYVGGIVGGCSGKVTNCSNSGAVGTLGTGFHAFLGGIVGEIDYYYGTPTVSDCYYLEQDGLQGVGNEEENKGVTPKDEDAYKSGEVANLLNQASGEEELWGQDFDKGYPVPLGCLSEEEREAYKIYSVTFTYTLPVEEAEEKTITLYGNSDTQLAAPEETAVEGYAVTWQPELPETFGNVKEGETSFTATFTQLYTLTITQPTEGGTISATVGETPVEDEVAEGATVTLEATPAAGYKFVEWDVKKSDGGESVTVTDNAFTMPADDVTVTATFQAIDYTITISETTNGTVTTDKTTAHIGDVVTLTVSPADGYELEDLTVEADGKTITVTDNKFTMPAGNVTVTATFQAIDYTITISETTNGAVTADKETANIGEEVALTVTPDAGYTLDVLTVKSGEATITVTDNKFTMPADNVTVTATFEKKPEPEPKPDPQPQPDPTPIYYNIQFEDICEGVDASLSKSVVKEGNQVSVYVEVEEGYDAENLKVMCKRSLYGYWEEVEEGVQPGEYIIYNVYTDIYVKVEGVEKIEIEEEPTGMSDIEGTKVYTQNGSLYVYTSQPQEVMIITMNGTILKRERQEGLRFYPLPKGVYIICIGEERYKVRN